MAATLVFLLTYVLISLRSVPRFPIERPAVALPGGALMLVLGVLTPVAARPVSPRSARSVPRPPDPPRLAAVPKGPRRPTAGRRAERNRPARGECSWRDGRRDGRRGGRVPRSPGARAAAAGCRPGRIGR